MKSGQKMLLLTTWKSNLFAHLTISDVMQINKKRTKPWVYLALQDLTRDNLLIRKKQANAHIYMLNTTHPLVFQILQYFEALESLQFPHNNIIIELVNEIKETPYCLIIFGSYAKGKPSTKSDLDICFLVQDKDAGNRIASKVKRIKLNHPIALDEQYITFADFTTMLLRKEENLGKEIVRNHIIFLNADIYYQILTEAHRNGYSQE